MMIEIETTPKVYDNVEWFGEKSKPVIEKIAEAVKEYQFIYHSKPSKIEISIGNNFSLHFLYGVRDDVLTISVMKIPTIMSWKFENRTIYFHIEE